MNILAVSDVDNSLIYSPQVKQRFQAVDLVLGCGDLRYSYLEYIISMLDVPLYYVHGNHANQVEVTVAGEKIKPDGGINLNGKCMEQNGLLLAGVEGCLKYNDGPFQYTQAEMWARVFLLIPGLLRNHLRRGRYLDVFVTHAPPAGIHDGDDLPHRGIRAFNWLLRVFQPRYHLHGHTHVYSNTTPTVTVYYRTKVINAYGFKELAIDLPEKQRITYG